MVSMSLFNNDNSRQRHHHRWTCLQRLKWRDGGRRTLTHRRPPRARSRKYWYHLLIALRRPTGLSASRETTRSALLRRWRTHHRNIRSRNTFLPGPTNWRYTRDLRICLLTFSQVLRRLSTSTTKKTTTTRSHRRPHHVKHSMPPLTNHRGPTPTWRKGWVPHSSYVWKVIVKHVLGGPLLSEAASNLCAVTLNFRNLDICNLCFPKVKHGRSVIHSRSVASSTDRYRPKAF